MDRDQVKHLRGILQDGLEQALTTSGYSVQVGRATFSDSNATFKITVAETDTTGKAITPELEALREYRERLGLPEDIEDKVLRIGGTEVKLIGYKPRSRKYPYIGQSTSDHRRWKFAHHTVKFALAGNSYGG